MNDVVVINETVRTEEQTPIEIALEVNEDGMVSAKHLYNWLEYDPSHYSRWCQDNLINNISLEEDVDFKVFRHNGEKYLDEDKTDGRGRPSIDYLITLELAKELAMMARSERGKAARKYFNKIEGKFAFTVKQYNELLDNYNKLKKQLNELAIGLNTNIDKLDCRVACIESGTSVSGGRLSPWVKDMSSKVMELADYYENTVKKMYSVIIARMENKFGIFFQKYFDEYVTNHPDEKPVWRIVVIEYYDLKDLFESAYKELAKEIGLYSDNRVDNYYDF